MFRSGSVCGIRIWIRLETLDLDLNGTCDLFRIWDPNGTREPCCVLDPFETKPGSVLLDHWAEFSFEIWI